MIRNFKGLGSEVAKIRRKQKLTQGEVAEKTGLKQQTISEFENGRPASINTLFLILEVLGMEMQLTPRGVKETKKADWLLKMGQK